MDILAAWGFEGSARPSVDIGDPEVRADELAGFAGFSACANVHVAYEAVRSSADKVRNVTRVLSTGTPRANHYRRYDARCAAKVASCGYQRHSPQVRTPTNRFAEGPGKLPLAQATRLDADR